PATAAAAGSGRPERSLLEIYRDRRFWVCVVLVIVVNLTWHFFRVWLPLFLREGRGYSASGTNYFTAAYYVAADAGALAAGFATLWLTRRGWSVHRSRLFVYAASMLLTTLSLAVAYVPRGPGLFLLTLLL